MDYKICLVKSTITDPEICCVFSNLSSHFHFVEKGYWWQPAAAAFVQTDSQESQKEHVRDHKFYWGGVFFCVGFFLLFGWFYYSYYWPAPTYTSSNT